MFNRLDYRQRNYIPHRTPNNPSYKRWYNNYQLHLRELYQIFVSTLTDRYEIKTDLYDNVHFNKFCFFIYKSSSKHIIKI
jgi:hypothetical protein